eukprot:7914058-Pyramimonas_sp.AAC.1
MCGSVRPLALPAMTSLTTCATAVQTRGTAVCSPICGEVAPLHSCADTMQLCRPRHGRRPGVPV